MLLLSNGSTPKIVLGPFVDDTDGKTPEGGLTISQADVRLSKNGGDFEQKNDITSATHMEYGYYSVTLNATDTGTNGRLTVAVAESGALPVWAEFLVVPANVYNAICAETGYIGANILQISGDGTAADNLEAACDGNTYNLGGGAVVAASVTGAVGSVTGNVGGNVTGSVGSVTGAVGSVTGAVGSVTGNVGGNVTGSVGSVASGGITAASIATGAIDADALAADAVTEIWSKAMTELSAVPGVTGTVLEALQWLFLLSRNAITQTNSLQSLLNNAGGGPIATATVSDDGTTFTRAKFS